MRRALEERRADHARSTFRHRQRAEKVRKRLRELDAVAKEWGERSLGATGREDG
jgi:hypothetical protein